MIATQTDTVMKKPKYSKLFIQIVWETSVRESDYPGNVRYPPEARSSGLINHDVFVQETDRRENEMSFQRK